MASPRIIAAIAVVAAVTGLGGYLVGSSSAPNEAEASNARQLAYDIAFRAALSPAAREAMERGYAEGLEQGRRAGERAAKDAAEKELARRRRLQAMSAEVWAVGDGGDGGSNARRVAALIARDPPDRFFYLGDVYDGETLAEYNAEYGDVFGRFDRVAAPTPGNHEWPVHENGYDRYWQLTKAQPQPPWYDFTLAGWQVFSLNSEANHSSGSPQVRWLKQRLDGSPQFGNCRLGFWHRPFFSAGKYQGEGGDLAPFWNALRGRARLVLSAHDHNMQRFAPRDGITQLIAGSGGHGRYPVGDAPGLEFANDSDYGALRLELRRGRAKFAFFSIDGERLDSGQVSCQRKAGRD